MISSLEQKLWNFLETLFPKVHKAIVGKRKMLAFLVAGGIAVSVDTGTLYLLKSIFGFALTPAVALAFLVGFCTSFLLQKFWTFKDSSVDKVHTQVVLYFIVAVANFFLTIILMKLMVEVLHFQYILSKLFVALSIAFCTFFIYQAFIFKQSS